MKWLKAVGVLLLLFLGLIPVDANQGLAIVPKSALAGEVVLLFNAPIGQSILMGGGNSAQTQYPKTVNLPTSPCQTDLVQKLAPEYVNRPCVTLEIPAKTWGGIQTISVGEKKLLINVYGQNVVNSLISRDSPFSRQANFFLWVPFNQTYSYDTESASITVSQVTNAVNTSSSLTGVTLLLKETARLTKPTSITSQPSNTCKGFIQQVQVSVAATTPPQTSGLLLGRAIELVQRAQKTLATQQTPQTDVISQIGSDPTPGYAQPMAQPITAQQSDSINNIQTALGATPTIEKRGGGATIVVFDSGVGKPSPQNNFDLESVLTGENYDIASTSITSGTIGLNRVNTNTVDQFDSVFSTVNPLNIVVKAHGTAVASFAAGKTHNIAGSARILPMKVCSQKGVCEVFSLWQATCAGLVAAKRSGKPFIFNYSLGSDTPSSILHSILKEAFAANLKVDVVASAGNTWNLVQPATGTTDYVGTLRHYPAAEAEPNSSFGGLPVIAVGAVGRRSQDSPWQMADFSNQGSYVNILAPGIRVRGINPCPTNTPACDLYSGTSFAAPLVAGALAVYRTKNDMKQFSSEEFLKSQKTCSPFNLPILGAGSVPVLQLKSDCF